MKVKKPKIKPKAKTITKEKSQLPVWGVGEYIKVIQNLLRDIQLHDDENEDNKDYEGIITVPTAKRLKKILPDEFKKLDLK